jgi:hypothetical protein
MLQAFPNQTDTTQGIVKQREQLNKTFNDSDSFWSKASELDSKRMLEELS